MPSTEKQAAEAGDEAAMTAAVDEEAGDGIIISTELETAL
jgi:hypothetical protein